jgi:hypothetical protein
MGAPYVPTNDPLTDANRFITDVWRRYQEYIASAITPGGANYVLTSNGTALVWKLLTDGNVSGAASVAWSKVDKAGSTLADLATRSATDLTSGTLNDARLSTTVTLQGNLTVGSGSIVLGSGVHGTGSVLLGTSGTYTPTLTGVANVAASTAYACQYVRVGNVVTVTGKVDVDPTAAVATQLGISLPVASNLATAQQCAGVAFSPTIAGQGAAILGDTANDRAQMEWIAVDVTNQPMAFTFMYLVV